MSEEKKEPIVHLLIPKEFRVWCRPQKLPGKEMKFTRLPSACTCANCLTRMRTLTTGRGGSFRVSHTGREPFYPENQP